MVVVVVVVVVVTATTRLKIIRLFEHVRGCRCRLGGGDGEGVHVSEEWIEGQRGIRLIVVWTVE